MLPQTTSSDLSGVVVSQTEIGLQLKFQIPITGEEHCEVLHQDNDHVLHDTECQHKQTGKV